MLSNFCPKLSPFFVQNFVQHLCPKICPIFVQNFAHFLSQILSNILSKLIWGGGTPGPPNWGDTPWGHSPQLEGYPRVPQLGGYPWGRPPPVVGVPPGAPPPQLGRGTPGGIPQLEVEGYPRGCPPVGGGIPGAPVNRQTENITFPSYSVCGR